MRGFGFRQNCDLDEQIGMHIFQLVRFCNFEKFWALQNPLVKQKSGLVCFKPKIFSPRRTDDFRDNNDGRNLENFRSKKTPENA